MGEWQFGGLLTRERTGVRRAMCLEGEGKMPSVRAGGTPATRISGAILVCGPLGVVPTRRDLDFGGG